MSDETADWLMRELRRMDPSISGAEAMVPIVPGPGLVRESEALRRGARPLVVEGEIHWDLGRVTDRSGDPEIAFAESLPEASFPVDLGGFGKTTSVAILVAAAAAVGVPLALFSRSVKRLADRGIALHMLRDGGADLSTEASMVVGEDFVRRLKGAGVGFTRGDLMSSARFLLPGATVAALVVLYLVLVANWFRHPKMHWGKPVLAGGLGIAEPSRTYTFKSVDPAAMKSFFTSAGVDKASELDAHMAELKAANPGKDLTKIKANDTIVIPASWPDRPFYKHASPAPSAPKPPPPPQPAAPAAPATNHVTDPFASVVSAVTKASPLLSMLTSDSSTSTPSILSSLLEGAQEDGQVPVGDGGGGAAAALLVVGLLALVGLGWKYQDRIVRALTREGAKRPEVVQAAVDEAMRDPKVLQAVLEATLRDPKAVNRVLSAASTDPKLVQEIVRAASKNPQAVQAVLNAASSDPAATKSVVDAAMKDPRVVSAVATHAAQGATQGVPVVVNQAVQALTSLVKPSAPSAPPAVPPMRVAGDDPPRGDVEVIHWVPVTA